MANPQEIDNAIGAHGLWKGRLKTAIDTGKIDVPVETIRKDNQCPFGKWLYGTSLSTAERNSSHYRTVKDLHAEFHKTAAHVTELALAGKKDQAQAMMRSSGEYANVTTRLTLAMMDWKQALS